MSAPLQLSNLDSWTRAHIKDVFEARTSSIADDAIASTFSASLTGSMVNGEPFAIESMSDAVNGTRALGKPDGLTLRWHETVELSKDPATNRDGVFAGVYTLEGIFKPSASGEVIEYGRRKAINVIIKSESDDLSIDSRRIVTIIVVQNDYPVVA